MTGSRFSSGSLLLQLMTAAVLVCTAPLASGQLRMPGTPDGPSLRLPGGGTTVGEAASPSEGRGDESRNREDPPSLPPAGSAADQRRDAGAAAAGVKRSSPATAGAKRPAPAKSASPAKAGTASGAARPALPAAGETGRGTAPASMRDLDRIAAIVNKDVITIGEVERRTRMVEGQLRAQGVELPSHDQLRQQVLERLIVDRAQVQMAIEQGLRVDDAQLERALSNIARENGVTMDQMRKQIESEGQSFDTFREDIRGEMMRLRLREREVDSRVKVSEADIDAFLAAQGVRTGGAPAPNASSQRAPADTGDPSSAASAGTAEYQLAHIVLRLPENANADEAAARQQLAEELRAKAAAGEDFGRLAAGSSDAPDALQGGQMGWRTADRLPELYAQGIQQLEPGQVSPVLRSPAGFHVLKLIARRTEGSAASAPAASSSGTGVAVRQTHARHILIRPSETVSLDEARRRLLEIRERVVSGQADFAEMARQYSVDGSAGRGGDLGWVYPGDTVPEFERAMDALQPGAVSEPIRTPFGLHLVEVLGRRTDDASPERLRQRAREVIRARRIEERTEDWLREVRDNAYVEKRLDGN